VKEETLQHTGSNGALAPGAQPQGSERLEDLDACYSRQYYAVAKGRRPSIYNDWDEAKQQGDGLSSNLYAKFVNRTSAVTWLRDRGLPDDEIRLFRKAFKLQPNSRPIRLQHSKTNSNVSQARSDGPHQRHVRPELVLFGAKSFTTSSPAKWTDY
jgi:hypothetical protein